MEMIENNSCLIKIIVKYSWKITVLHFQILRQEFVGDVGTVIFSDVKLFGMS